jgi:hypothetical protein
MDPYDAFDMEDARLERLRRAAPRCCVCREHITCGGFYDFDGDIVCEDCVDDYIHEYFWRGEE